MAFQNDGPVQTFVAGGTITKWALVKLNSSGYVVVTEGGAASSGTDDTTVIGVAQDAASSGEPVSVRRLNCVASVKVAAANSLSIGDILYAGASGQAVASAAGDTQVGIALQATTAAGDIIEMLPKTA